MGQSGHGWGRVPPCASRCVASLDGYEKALSQSGQRCGRWGGGRRRGREGAPADVAGPGTDSLGFCGEPWWGATGQEGWWAPGINQHPESRPGFPSPTPTLTPQGSSGIPQMTCLYSPPYAMHHPKGSKGLPGWNPKATKMSVSSIFPSDHPEIPHIKPPDP